MSRSDSLPSDLPPSYDEEIESGLAQQPNPSSHIRLLPSSIENEEYPKYVAKNSPAKLFSLSTCVLLLFLYDFYYFCISIYIFIVFT